MQARSKQQGRLLPSIYETAPTPEGAQLLQLGQRGILAAAVSSTSASRSAQGGPRSRDSPLGPLWRLLVAARVAAVPHSRDPTLLTYVGAPSGVKGLHSTFSSRKGCSLASTGGVFTLVLCSTTNVAFECSETFEVHTLA